MSREIIDSERIAARVKELGQKISADYAAGGVNEITLLCVLNGAMVFTADLMRAVSLDVIVDTLRAASYGAGTSSCGNVETQICKAEFVSGRHVLLIDDILDTGRTAHALCEDLKKLKPASLKTCFLLSKPSRREVEIAADYIGFEIDDVFVYGYGLDADYKFRHLPNIEC